MQGLFFSVSASEETGAINPSLSIWEKPRYEKARLAVERGHLDLAIPELKKIIVLYPDNVEAHAYLGWAYSQKGLIPCAVEEFQKIFQINPDLRNTSFDYPMTKDTPDAVREFVAEFEDFIDLINEFPGAHEVLGFSYVQLGRLGGALNAYKNVLKLRRIDGKETLSGIDQAIQEYEDVLRLKPNCVEAFIKLACAHAEKGMPDISIADIQKAVSIEPDRVDTRVYLACFYAKKRMLNEALQALGEAKKIRETILENLIAEGKRCLDDGIFKKAITMAQEALKIYPGSKKAYWLLITAYDRNSEPDKAAEVCKEVLSRYPDDIPAYTFLAWIYIQCDLSEQAKDTVEQAMRIEPENTDIQALAAFLYASQDQLQEAIAMCNMALDTMSMKSEIANDYGWIRGKIPSIEQKFREVMDIIELKPDYAEVYLCLGWLHAKNGEQEKAIAALKRAVELTPGSYTTHRYLGNVYVQSGKIKEALDEYEQALHILSDTALQ
ncbi:MAG: hypothetical protein CV087_00790 [Candidatus Brocadia sp. WS118]|nr:MAG: hypothetical protein CV087_00790 [Candidatus Brocadia sp. WS118]